MNQLHTCRQTLEHKDIEITIDQETILVTPHFNITNENIALFNNEISNKIENLPNIKKVNLDLRNVQALPFFLIGSLLSIYDKIKPTELQIQNASPYTTKILTEYALDKIFTIKSSSKN